MTRKDWIMIVRFAAVGYGLAAVLGLLAALFRALGAM